MNIWTQKQIRDHGAAAHKLGLVKNEFAFFVRENLNQNKEITENNCIEFIKKMYKKHGLKNDKPKESCIVAFGLNTNEVHYFPTKKSNSKLKENTLILLDIWARLDKKDTPYADVTFMFYSGKKIPSKIKNVWKILSKSRDNAIKYIDEEIKNKRMPRGLDIDRVAHDYIGDNKLGHGIKHTIGHSLGFDSPHGKLPGINWREYSPIIKNMGYTIEPGIYLEKFGMRTEIDFYIDNENKIIITTPVQEKLEIISSK